MKTPSRAFRPINIECEDGETEVEVSFPIVREMGVSAVEAYIEAKYYHHHDTSEHELDESDNTVQDKRFEIDSFVKNGGTFMIARENQWIELNETDKIWSGCSVHG